MTDNFENIRMYLKNEGLVEKTPQVPEIYYAVELIRRGKDNPNLSAANYHFKNYYITSLEMFDKLKDEITKLCNLLQLRAYISVNKKSFKQVMLDTCAEYARRIAEGDYKKPQSIFESCSGKYVIPHDNKFVIDIDYIENGYSEQVFNTAQNCQSSYSGNNVLLQNPSKTGLHLITHGFNVQEFCTIMNIINKKYESDYQIHLDNPKDMIHKNHITLLYENIENE